jgi:high affinity sulfate transporter 1
MHARTLPPTGWRRRLPGVAVARDYRREWLVPDISTGLVLTAILVPVGMSYAEASGLPAINGLYATIVPLIAYALLGPSRILVLGPDSSLAAIIAGTVVPLAAGDPERLVPLAGALAVAAGVITLAAGLLKLGFLSDLISMPIRLGYLHGIALTVLVGQLPKLFGFDTDGIDLFSEATAFLEGLAAGSTVPASLAIGVASMAVILGCRRFVPRIPGVLVAVVGATIVTWAFDLGATAGVAVVGVLPQGLPSLVIPTVGLSDIGPLVAGGAAIALVSMADTSILARTFAARRGERVDQDQELVALGAANLAAGVTQGFAVSGSSSRTPVAEAVGAKTQLTGLVGALAIGVMLVAAPGLTAHLPTSCLAAIVIVACLGIVDVPGVMRMARLRPSEAVLSVVCFLGVAILGVVPGIIASVGVALGAFVWRAWRPYHAVLGRVEGVKGYHDVTRYPDARLIPGLVLFRWDAPLFFANAGMFREHVLEAVAASAEPVRWIGVAAEPVTDIDLTAADMLDGLLEELDEMGVTLVWGELKDPVKDRLRQYGLFDRMGARHFFPTIGSLVDGYVATTGVEWVDWEERHPSAAGVPDQDAGRPER